MTNANTAHAQQNNSAFYPEPGSQLDSLLHTTTRTTKEDDYALALRYLRGDGAAGNLLFTAAYPKVWRYVHVELSSGPMCDETEDIVSDAFLLALGKLRRFNGTCEFSVFVNGIAKRLIRNQWKKMKAQKIVPLFSEDEDEAYWIEDTDTSNDPVFMLEQKDNRERAARALPPCMERLAPKQKQSVQLRVYSELSFREIGERMGGTEAAAGEACRAGLRRLRAMMERAGCKGNGYWKAAAA
ncbi:MAG: RNA polymerase sigma factor [Firmicutes bacterium]|nr:RNA polymerase sigma factor [Bacillota bacterium]